MNQPPSHLRQYFLQPGAEPPPRRINVDFYMKATVEEALEHLRKTESPLDYGKPLDEGWHFLVPKSHALDGNLLLGVPDEEILEQPEHAEIEKMLGFRPSSHLSYGDVQ